jgi:hypothetical protein
MSGVDESNSDRQDQSAESSSGNNDTKTQADQHDCSREQRTRFPTLSRMTAMAAGECTEL